MARRKRLTPARPDFLSDPGAPAAEGRGPDTSGAPIARVTGDAATVSALAEVSEELGTARREGRLVQRLPLAAVDADYLVRDRIAAEDAELEGLVESLRRRGQQTPVEVAALAGDRFGLISGWRRLTALRRLHAETGEEGFATVLALLREPATAADAYLAMVEENEIRVGLSYYERARIVARAVEAGVYADVPAALRALFAAASRAKRSKIGAFLPLYTALDHHLRFPAAIAERQGLALARALEADPGLAERLCAELRAADPATEAAEQAVLARAAAPAAGETAAAKRSRPAAAEEPAPGIRLETGGSTARPRLTLSGPGIDAAFRERLRTWLADQG